MMQLIYVSQPKEEGVILDVHTGKWACDLKSVNRAFATPTWESHDLSLRSLCELSPCLLVLSHYQPWRPILFAHICSHLFSTHPPPFHMSSVCCLASGLPLSSLLSSDLHMLRRPALKLPPLPPSSPFIIPPICSMPCAWLVQHLSWGPCPSRPLWLSVGDPPSLPHTTPQIISDLSHFTCLSFPSCSLPHSL